MVVNNFRPAGQKVPLGAMAEKAGAVWSRLACGSHVHGLEQTSKCKTAYIVKYFSNSCLFSCKI